jgi:hypothetical protein
MKLLVSPKGVAVMSSRWSVEQAAEWYTRVGTIRGCNYLPRTAVNSTEMWQADTFDLLTMAEELGWAQTWGYNSVRVFLPYLVWQADSTGFKARMRQFLDCAMGHGMTTMFILFDDCAFAGKEPYLGRQDDPIQGLHNSGWTPSPGHARTADRQTWASLKQYVQDIVATFGSDPRVIAWDMYNEPGNARMGEKSLPLVDVCFEWARETSPDQPLTGGVWTLPTGFKDAISMSLFQHSDIISFHHYKAEGLDESIATCKAFGRPVVCTEWLHRFYGQTPAVALPVFAREQVGWYQWGLVAGRTQTYLNWTSKAGDPHPDIWQHDVFHADGAPYDASELALLRDFHF